MRRYASFILGVDDSEVIIDYPAAWDNAELRQGNKKDTHNNHKERRKHAQLKFIA